MLFGNLFFIPRLSAITTRDLIQAMEATELDGVRTIVAHITREGNTTTVEEALVETTAFDIRILIAPKVHAC